MSTLWPPSFPEVVARAEEFWTCHRFFDASREFQRAASVAPTDAQETLMLERSWVAQRRLYGLPSELETSGGR